MFLSINHISGFHLNGVIIRHVPASESLGLDISLKHRSRITNPLIGQLLCIKCNENPYSRRQLWSCKERLRQQKASFPKNSGHMVKVSKANDAQAKRVGVEAIKKYSFTCNDARD